MPCNADGIDWGGERIADEVSRTLVHSYDIASHESLQVSKKVKELEEGGKTAVRFSIIGYSLGGLLARYVIGYAHLSS